MSDFDSQNSTDTVLVGGHPVVFQTSHSTPSPSSSVYVCSISIRFPNRVVPNRVVAVGSSSVPSSSPSSYLSLASVVKQTLDVDTEVSSAVHRLTSLSSSAPEVLYPDVLHLTFSAANPKMIRVSVRSFLDMLLVSIRTLLEFDTSVAPPPTTETTNIAFD